MQHERVWWRHYATRQICKVRKARQWNTGGITVFTILLLKFSLFDNLFLFSMSQQAGYSPSFKRPAEIMRMRRKRARSDASVFSSPSGQDSTGSTGQSESSPASVRPFSPGPFFHTQNRSGGGIKRRNPFANIENTYSPKKKLLIYNDDGNAEAADRINRSTEKDGDEDMSTKTECQGVLSFSARLTEVEKQQRPTKVGCHIWSYWLRYNCVNVCVNPGS